MEAIILILIIGSFACWCFSQGSKSRKESELEKLEAWSEDMYRRYKDKDAELRAKSITPGAKSTARSQATQPSNPGSTSTGLGPSQTAASLTTNLRSPLSSASRVPKIASQNYF